MAEQVSDSYTDSLMDSPFVFSLHVLVPWQVKLDSDVDPSGVSFSWTWSNPEMSLAEAAQGGQTDLDSLVILPEGLQSITSFTISVEMSSLAQPDKTVTLQADIQVHAGLVALPGGLQVTT